MELKIVQKRVGNALAVTGEFLVWGLTMMVYGVKQLWRGIMVTAKWIKEKIRSAVTIIRHHWSLGSWLVDLTFVTPSTRDNESLPSRWNTRWATRSIIHENVEFYCSEGDEDTRPVPNVTASLDRINVTTWFGKEYTVWCSDTFIELMSPGGVREFGHMYVTGVEADAWKWFMDHQFQIREQLVIASHSTVIGEAHDENDTPVTR